MHLGRQALLVSPDSPPQIFAKTQQSSLIGAGPASPTDSYTPLRLMESAGALSPQQVVLALKRCLQPTAVVATSGPRYTELESIVTRYGRLGTDVDDVVESLLSLHTRVNQPEKVLAALGYSVNAIDRQFDQRLAANEAADRAAMKAHPASTRTRPFGLAGPN